MIKREVIKRLFFTAASVLSFCTAVLAQDKAFTAENFPGRDNELKQALINMQKGDEMYFQEPPYYQVALPFYEKASKFNPDNADLNNKLGVCYLNSNNKFKAYDFLSKAFKINGGIDAMIHYNLGRGLQLNAEWDKAISEYNLYLLTTVNDEKRKSAQKRILECTNGKELSTKPVNVKIENLGPAINSRYPDYTPLISADESVLFFTSRREDTFGGETDLLDQEFFEDIYKSEKVNGVWMKAKNMGAPVNTKTHDAGAGVSPDGHTMFVFKGDKNNGDILISKLINGTWTKPEDAGKNINTKFHESAACLSPEGTTLFFVSDKPGGFGGRDIYRSRWDNLRKEWGPTQNLGETINTPYDEEGVFMHPDGRTLYFSSTGDKSIGGYDIFYSTLINETWTTPVTMGIPVNTPDDDVFFEVSASGSHGYYASVRKEGYGEKDIYRVNFLADEKPVSRMTILKGTIRNSLTKEPLDATIELIDLNKGEHIGVFSTDSKTGKYLVSLPSGKNYGAVAYSKDYLFESQNFDIPDSASYSEVVMDIEMKPLTEGNNIILTNIFFDTDKFQIKNESKDVLDRLVRLMKDYPTLRVEISGHTDNIGSDEYNQRLSENRAKSVTDYMIANGTSKERLTYVGMGKTKPFTTNDTPENRQKNRRIEFKILAK